MWMLTPQCPGVTGKCLTIEDEFFGVEWNKRTDFI